MSQEESKQLSLSDDRFLQEFNRRLVRGDQIIKIVVKATKSDDWMDYGGQAWLSSAGCQRVMLAINMSYAIAQPIIQDREDEKGKYFTVAVSGEFYIEHTPRKVTAWGFGSSRKALHFKAYGKERELPEINLNNVVQDAIKNCIEQGVTQFLGIRGLKWEFLATQGIDRSMAQKVEFRSKKPKEGE